MSGNMTVTEIQTAIWFLKEKPLEGLLKELFHNYRVYLNDRSPETTSDMHRIWCCILRLELELFLKLKHFFDNQLHNTEAACATLAKDIRDAYPINMFNELLQEYFEAAMSSSEGNVMPATELTTDKFKGFKQYHRLLGAKNLD
jgi:hypothetical protein